MLTEKQIIAALRRLERNWPRDYFLWAGEGGLQLRRFTEEGALNIPTGRLDDPYEVEHFDIPNDGGAGA